MFIANDYRWLVLSATGLFSIKRIFPSWQSQSPREHIPGKQTAALRSTLGSKYRRLKAEF